MFDETVNYCKIFKGPQEELYDDCLELGFASYPFISECTAALDPANNDQCHVSYIWICDSFSIIILFVILFKIRNVIKIFSSIFDKITAATKKTYLII